MIGKPPNPKASRLIHCRRLNKLSKGQLINLVAELDSRQARKIYEGQVRVLGTFTDHLNPFVPYIILRVLRVFSTKRRLNYIGIAEIKVRGGYNLFVRDFKKPDWRLYHPDGYPADEPEACQRCHRKAVNNADND